MAALIDTQGPLARRKALIAKLMAQVQGAPGGAAPSRVSRSAPASGSTMGVRPSNLEPRSAAIQALAGVPRSSGASVAAMPNVSTEVRSGDTGGYTPASATPASPPAQWQSGGFLSSELYNSFQSLSDFDRERIMNQPHLRRRYFG